MACDNPGMLLPSTFTKLKSLLVVSLEGNGYCNETVPSPLLQSTWITSIFLRRNQLTSVPCELRDFKKLTKIALGGNKIKFYPPWLFTELPCIEIVNQGDESEICIPPPEIWSQGVPGVRAYYESLSKSGDEFDERLKVLVLGDTMAGKTSLIQSILSGKSFLTLSEERTVCVDIHDYKFQQKENSTPLAIKFWDFGGEDCYYYVNSFFISPNALILLVVDATQCLDSTLKRVHMWTNMVLSRIPTATFIIVATHIDEIKERSKLDGIQEAIINSKK